LARSGSAWSVKGIDAETRAVARSRAGTADLTIGSWIDQAILAHAGGPARAGSANRNIEPLEPAVAIEGTAPTPSIAGLGEGDLLDLIDQELEASRDRLDQSLRPVGFALKDLALRLVAAEALQRVDRPAPGAGSVGFHRAGESRHLDSQTDPVPAGAPRPPLGSLAPRIDPAEIPPPPASGPVPGPAFEAGSVSDNSRERPAPIPPLGNLGTIEPGEMPVPPLSQETRPDASVAASGRGPPPPPTQDLDGPGVRFTGLQGGFESDPGLAVVEARADTGRKAMRALRIAAGLAPFLIVGALAAGYYLAEPLGIAPLRDKLGKRLAEHASATEKTLADAYDAALEQFGRLTGDQESMATPASPPRPEPSQRTASVAADSPPPKPRISPKVAETRSKKTVAPAPSPAPSARAPVPDDPSIANLGATGVQKPTKPVVEEKNPSPSPRLAKLPPARPVLPEKNQTPAQIPKARTKLAALPVAPPLAKAAIPPSKLDGKARIETLRVDARAGDPRAQHELGRRLIQGDGVKRDYEAGSEWFREAAIQGVSNAQYNLAVLYERGLGVTKDDVRALLWYHSAAEQSHPLAQYNLGIFYLQGRGIPLSYAEAARWFTSASNQGVARATYNLAVLTEDGLGLPPNREKAITLYEKASRAGHHEATSRLALLRGPNAGNNKPATFEETANTQAEGASSGTTVADIQAYLRNGGMYNGRIDGIAGPKTRTAIREYQRRHALPITGIPTEILLDYMKASAGSDPTKTSASG
jgi:TPR repeat protein